MNDPRRTTGTAFTRAWPVLYVDDEPGNLLPFTLQFRDEFEIMTAANGREAMEVLATTPVAVLLTDHRMPELTGVDLCEQVRDRWPHVLRILVTAYSDQQVAIDAINRGGVLRYITKPWNVESVRQILRESVARASLERTVRKLRLAIMDKERLLGQTAVRARLIHDLAQANVSVAHCCDNLERLETPLRETLTTDTYETYREEVGELRRYVNYLDELHDRTPPQVSFARPALEQHDLTELLRTVARLVRSDLDLVATLSVDCPADAQVYADRTDVSRILVNLIGNAGRALREAEFGVARIGVDVRVAGGTVNIYVWDNGPQIPLELRQQIFDSYSGIRLAGTGRAGVDLLVCRELAIANGGSIEMARLVTEGRNTFHLQLPSQPAVAQPGSEGS